MNMHDRGHGDAGAMDRIIAAAAAAPSSHNSQPWQFRTGKNEIEVWGDATRMLPKSDVDHRQFFISIGCTIQNIMVAVQAEGSTPTLALFPDVTKSLFVARISWVSFQAGLKPDPDLLAPLWQRHANRDPYLPKPVAPDFLAYVRSLSSPDSQIFIIEDEAAKHAIAEVVEDSIEAAFHDKGFTEELSHWIRPSLKRYRDGMPGYNIGVPWLLSFLVPLAIRYANVAKQQRKMVEGPLAATPTYLIMATLRDTPAEWVAAGIVLERIWLAATEKGLVIGPLAAAVQIGQFYLDLQKILGTPLRPQVFVRLGYPTKIPVPAPRRDPATLIF
jgi:nitroreductase